MRGEFLIEQGSGLANEDRLLVEERIWAVFDGATSLNKYVDESGNTGGVLASSIANDTFRKNDQSLLDLAREANISIRDAMQEKSIDSTDKVNLWMTTAAVVRLLEREIEWLTLSDSIVMVFDTNDKHKILGTFHDHDVDALKLWKELAERKVENIFEQVEMKDALVKNRRQVNIKYGALNGEPSFIGFVNGGRYPRENIAHIVLATDGLFIPTENPEDECWDQFAALYLDGGLKTIRDFVREREGSDPKRWKYPRFKIHDDIGAIALSF
jgi:hypothetical protein